MIFVDTSVWVDYFNGFASKEAMILRKAIEENQSIVVGGVVLTEVLLGFKSDQDAERVADLLSAFELVSEFVRVDYLEAARLYRSCRSKGFTIRSTIDCLIAALCIRCSYALLSKDQDFSILAKHSKLRLVTL